jgi:hypothetical protein
MYLIAIFNYPIQVLFKRGNATQAITRYTVAASMAIQRPPWEASQFMREELTTAVSNRSAAYCDTRDYLSALADAETVIAIRRNWNKGHLRKAKALLGLGRFRDAADAVRLGLDFEPTSTVSRESFFVKNGNDLFFLSRNYSISLQTLREWRRRNKKWRLSQQTQQFPRLYRQQHEFQEFCHLLFIIPLACLLWNHIDCNNIP